MKRWLLLTMVITVTLASNANARIWYITADGTADAATIQAGIDSAAVSDTVLVAPGRYTGVGNRDIDFGGKDLVLLSEGGPKVTILDVWGGDGFVRGFWFHQGETAAAVVEGFTVTRGGYLDGSLIKCEWSSPTLTNCVFSDGNSRYEGGGMYCRNASPTLTDCIFYRNASNWEDGGGMYIYGRPSPTLINCILSENWAAGAGAGMFCNRAAPVLINCTISGHGFGNSMHCVLDSSPVLQNTIISFNATSGVYESVYCDGTSSISLTCCDVYGNAGGDWVGCISDQYGVNGNISEDPLFCGELNYPSDPYRIDIASPCARRHPPCEGELIGARPAGCSEGVHTEQTTWGRFKMMYR